MKIQFCDGKVKSLSISRPLTPIESDGQLVEFSTNSGFSSDLNKNYFISFNLTVETPCGAQVDIEYESVFSTSEEISEEFKISPFVMVNSPAIAYPFLRAYIATLLTLSGLDSVILPTINFQALYNDSLEVGDKVNR